MWQFNWGVFWAILVAGVILWTVLGFIWAMLSTDHIMRRLDEIAANVESISTVLAEKDGADYHD